MKPIQPRVYSKASKRRGNRFADAARWTTALVGTLYLSWLLLFPELSGSFGQWGAEHLLETLGWSSYLAPLFLVNGLVLYFRADRTAGWITVAFGSLLCLFSSSALMGLANHGGSLGAALAAALTSVLGGFAAFLLTLAVSLFCAQIFMDLRWSKGMAWLAKTIAEDFQHWQRSRRELASQVAHAAKVSGSDAATLEPPVREVVRPVVAQPEPEPAPRPARKEKAPEPAPLAPDSPYVNYKLPSLDLLHAPMRSADRGKPQESELVAAAENLEKVLLSFGVEARVSGYSPGPVITRYELSPAPGVKVSQIVGLRDDIALAMKAKGIRIIAPIPGKAAVGVEIPNARPAHVVLREILESKAMPMDAPRLSFAIGLASDGEPLSADLAKMPHLLVAGATNSGKSVLIHSLILSILFRARPDEVKFMMIDPKRLELTFYEGIPHLFDPMASADKVQVATNSKDAAKSLTAMVKLMERRYEKFQLYAVRNIDSYNLEADKRGEPREFYIVVVIDELADLMLVSQDTVEGSIQRLAQMARAVGIHLVLATQRPSVDVITGVIKANLPSRIALQVMSRIDSKVILDGSGAETLQGKGDLLYLAAGAQKPERSQGAYVSEEEIKKVADYLRSQGKPSYAAQETAKPGEADLKSFGVEPLEVSQALKLVLERRRVSQDLLKSQFGSSARATNLLSFLEVKEFIHKPEGSNRWEIHFDLIEDYLRKNFPQVPIDDRRRD